jgi:hypothetical protein
MVFQGVLTFSGRNRVFSEKLLGNIGENPDMQKILASKFIMARYRGVGLLLLVNYLISYLLRFLL